MANENKKREITESQQTRAYAAYYGLWIGVAWVASFGLTMYGFRAPMASSFGLLIGLCSFPLAIWLLRGFREVVAPLPLRRAWHMSWMMFLGAAMLCTAAQYIYFAYIDGGQLVRSYGEMLEQPEMQEIMQRMLPGQDAQAMMQEALDTFAASPPSQLVFQFLFWNVVLATLMAFPTALFSFFRPKENE